MIVGSAQSDITPQGNPHLVGFAVRVQPAQYVQDRLYCKALFLQDSDEQLLWLAVDLLGLERDFVTELRASLGKALRIPADRIMISTTHTHSGPAAFHLTGCGEYDADYVDWLGKQMHKAGQAAVDDAEMCEILAVESSCDIGIDRRSSPNNETDPRVCCLAFKRHDNTFNSVLWNYAMHPVCYRGRFVSSDYPGEVAKVISTRLPGSPIILFALGAAGNINPPTVGASHEEVEQLAKTLALPLIDKLLKYVVSAKAPDKCAFAVQSRIVNISLVAETTDQIREHARRALQTTANRQTFGSAYEQAVRHWQRSRMEEIKRGDQALQEMELFGIGLAGRYFIGVNAEIFCAFTHMVRQAAGPEAYAVSCANGLFGYLPTVAAYEQGGYEVESSMFYFNRRLPKAGSLELLAEEAAQLVLGLKETVAHSAEK